jgi:transglycosylase-like protein
MQRRRAQPDVSGEALSTASTEFKERSLAYWRRRAKRVYRAAQTPPHEQAFRCIHRHEAPWKANTGNGYYGGLQMDLIFQRQYGSRLVRNKGLAHRWTPLEQIWVGERALREGRGFYPWPVAARRCGLI